MGMKFNCGLFKNTIGFKVLESKINIQFFAEKKMSLHGQKLYDNANDIGLKNIIRELYRPGAQYGDGGTADAIRHEVKTGELTGGKSHILKGKERLINLDRFIKRSDISVNDKKIAKKLYDDLYNALGGLNETKRIK